MNVKKEFSHDGSYLLAMCITLIYILILIGMLQAKLFPMTQLIYSVWLGMLMVSNTCRSQGYFIHSDGTCWVAVGYT